MMEGLHKIFSKKNRTKPYRYESEYGDIEETDAEDLFMEESYIDQYDAEDEYFD